MDAEVVQRLLLQMKGEKEVLERAIEALQQLSSIPIQAQARRGRPKGSKNKEKPQVMAAGT